MVPTYPMVLFGGTGVEVIMQRGEFVVSLEKGWIKFLCQSHLIAELLKVSQARQLSTFNEANNPPNISPSQQQQVDIKFSNNVTLSPQEMRTELDNLLEEKIADPQLDLIKDKRGAIIIKTITRLISTE